jgi:hypothetical protein
MLLDRNVALAINVKASTLDHIARCSGSQIAPHLDNLSANNILQCNSFHVEDVTTRKIAGTSGGDSSSPRFGVRRKTLMHIEGTREGLGCTVLLRGARESELFRLKRVMRFAVFAAYCARLEVAFCADVFLSLAATLNGGAAMPGMALPTTAAAAAPPPLESGTNVVRTWEEWAIALGQQSLSEDRPVLSVSPYVQKWQVHEEGGDAAEQHSPHVADSDSLECSRNSSISDAAASVAAVAATEVEHQGMARVYYEHTTQVCACVLHFGTVCVLLARILRAK